MTFANIDSVCKNLYLECVDTEARECMLSPGAQRHSMVNRYVNDDQDSHGFKRTPSGSSASTMEGTHNTAQTGKARVGQHAYLLYLQIKLYLVRSTKPIRNDHSRKTPTTSKSTLHSTPHLGVLAKEHYKQCYIATDGTYTGVQPSILCSHTEMQWVCPKPPQHGLHRGAITAS